MEPELSAVVLPIPDAEPLVGSLRAELDRSAAVGVPAHVTVLYPFLAPESIDEAVLTALGEVIGTVPAFAASFARVGWFGTDVVWLAPEPTAPFRALTAAMAQRFALLPYGGAHGVEPVPHLTVGHDAPPARLRAAAAEVAAGLPVRAEITSARLMVGSTSWRTVAELPLAARSQPRAGSGRRAG